MHINMKISSVLTFAYSHISTQVAVARMSIAGRSLSHSHSCERIQLCSGNRHILLSCCIAKHACAVCMDSIRLHRDRESLLSRSLLSKVFIRMVKTPIYTFKIQKKTYCNWFWAFCFCYCINFQYLFVRSVISVIPLSVGCVHRYAECGHSLWDGSCATLCMIWHLEAYH